MGKKDKKDKKKNNSKPVQNPPPKDESGDVREVLQLFNKLEEMVIDGDPRVKEALKQKPGIQNLLRDDSSLYGLTPRSLIGQPRIEQQLQQQQQQQQLSLPKEGSNLSFLSQPTNNQFNLRYQAAPNLLQQPAYARSPRRNIIVPPIAIPEHSTLGDTFSDGYHAALVKQHPDGTLESMRMNRQVGNNRIQNPPFELRVTPRTNSIEKAVPTALTKVPPKLQQEKEKQPIVEEAPTSSRYHSFVYDDGKATNEVFIHLPNEEYHMPPPAQTKKEIPDVSANPVSKIAPELDDMDNIIAFPETTTNRFRLGSDYLSTTPQKTTTYNKEQTIYSTVIDENGGNLECFGCRLQVPKNAVKKKCLLRVSVLGISETPHKTERIFNRYVAGDETTGKVTMAITPTISTSPTDVEFLKPITIQLPTCIAVHGSIVEGDEENQQQSNGDNHDIKVDNVIVKIRNKNTRDVWIEADTEVFRSSESIIFNTQELGDFCAFYQEDIKEKQALSKRLAIYLFKSSDFRKKQFASILITEELPHVIQKGVEGMPSWLKYTDSCSNIIIPEGKNLVLYIEALDRTSCQTDANKIDIPWENLWHPECIIRKHIHVSLLKRDLPASVQIFVNDGKNKLQADFAWKTKFQTIHLPDLMTVEDAAAEITDGEKSEKDRFEQELLKKVTWKPETPVSKYVTNKELLNFAALK